MNLGTFLGFSASIIVFVVTVLMSFSNVSVIFDLHAGVIVIGGTLAVTFVCFPLKRVTNLLGVFIRRLLGHNKLNYHDIIDEIVLLSQASRKGAKAFESTIASLKDDFLRDAAGMLFWAQAEISSDEFRDLLETRARSQFRFYMNESKVFRTMAKFPPAFGLMGTTCGMIALLQSLGAEGAQDMIGPAMSIALVATLYGLVLTNFVFSPIAENLAEQANEDLLARNLAVEGMILIQANKPTKYVEEKVRSYLAPSQRLKPK